MADQKTVELLNDIAKFGANQMWHLRPDTAAGKLYDRIEAEIARLKDATAYTHADVTAAHTKGYELGMAQRTDGVRGTPETKESDRG